MTLKDESGHVVGEQFWTRATTLVGLDSFRRGTATANSTFASRKHPTPSSTPLRWAGDLPKPTRKLTLLVTGGGHFKAVTMIATLSGPGVAAQALERLR